MSSIEKTSLVFCCVAILFLSAIGAVEVYNKTVVGSVMRPWIVKVEVEEGVDTYGQNEIVNAGKVAMGIPEGRNRKEKK